MSYEIPLGWTRTTLEKIGKWNSGGTPSRQKSEFFGKGVPWVKSGDLKDGPILKTDEQITQLGLENSSAKLMPAGTVSMALYGATIGKLGLMTFPAATNQACANVIPDTKLIETKYLYYYLLSERRRFIEKGKGGAQPNISQEIVKSHPIALAPISEQHRIVAKLERLLEKVDASQKRVAKIPILLKRFRQSVLAAACSGRLTADWREDNPIPEIDRDSNENMFEIPSSWSWKEFKDVATEITVGFVGSMSKEYIASGIPFLRSQNVRPFYFDEANLKYISPRFHKKIIKSRLNPKDVAIVRSGNSGEACVIPESLKEANCSDLVILRVGPEIDPHFSCIYMNSSLTMSHVNSVKVGIAQGHFNVGSMKKTPVPIPPIREQKEIVRRVENLFSLTSNLEIRHEKAQAHIDKLTQAILAKAFRGELVPQNPNDKPASDLLEKIITAHNQTKKTNSNGKRSRKVRP